MNNKLNNIQIYLTFLIVVILILLSTGVKTSAANFKLNSSVLDQSLIPKGRLVPKFDQSQKKSMTNKVIPYDIQNDWNNCVWKLQDNGTLTISPKLNSDGQLGVASNGTDPTTVRGGPWNAINFKITKVVIEKGVKANSNSSYLFSDLNNVTEIIGLENLDTSNVTNMHAMFQWCSNLTNLDLSKFDTRNVTDMSSMFYRCSNLANLDLSKFDTSNVTNMSFMINSCSNLTDVNLSSFNTSKVTNMSCMFLGCSNLANLDLSKFDTSNVTDMSSMFDRCSNLANLDLSKFDTSNVTDMSSMFDRCSNLTDVNLSSFNTSKVTDMFDMFDRCPHLTELDLSSFDTSAIPNMNNMFANSPNLWKITMGKKFKIKDGNTGYPTAPSSATFFWDDGKKYINSGDEKWQAVNSGDGGTVHKPKGEIFANKSFPEQRAKDGQETYVWKHQLFNEAPQIEIDKDSVKEGVKYPYVEDYRKSENLLPSFKITGNVSDSDSDSVSIYYTIDKEIDPNDPDQLNTISRLSASVDSKKINNVGFNVEIKKDDLKILATPKKEGHKIWIYARDGGSQGAKDNSKLSEPKQCWIAENGIIDFQYIGPEGKILKQPKTLVRIINTETNISEENPDYYFYKVSDYLPKSIWTSSTRYILSKFPSDLESLSDNNDRGRIPSTIKENDTIRTIRLNYYLAGQVSLKQVPNLDFGSHVSQNVLQGDQLNLQHDAKQELIVNDTTQRNTTDPSWQLFLEIKPLKDDIGFFRYYKDGNNCVDVSTFNNVASSEDTDLDTREDSDGKETNISNNWWNTEDNKQIKGPKLVLKQGNPPAGKYVTEATWIIENVPL